MVLNSVLVNPGRRLLTNEIDPGDQDPKGFGYVGLRFFTPARCQTHKSSVESIETLDEPIWPRPFVQSDIG